MMLGWLLLLLVATPAAALTITEGEWWDTAAGNDFGWTLIGDGFFSQGDTSPSQHGPLMKAGDTWQVEDGHTTTLNGVTTHTDACPDCGIYAAEVTFVHAAPCPDGCDAVDVTLPFTMTGTWGVNLTPGGFALPQIEIPLTGQGTVHVRADEEDVFYHYRFAPPTARAAVPEPGTLALLGLGLGWVAWRRR